MSIENRLAIPRGDEETLREYLERVAADSALSEDRSAEVVDEILTSVYGPTAVEDSDALTELAAHVDAETVPAEGSAEDESDATAGPDTDSSADASESAARTPASESASAAGLPAVRSRLPSTPFERRSKEGPAWTVDEPVVVYALVAAIAVIGLLFRMSLIDQFPLHGDEANNLAVVRLWHETGRIVYRPFNHGILLFFVTTFLYPTHDFFASQLVWARWIVAETWILAIPMLLLLRDELGDIAVLVGAVVLAFHKFGIRSSLIFRQDAMLASLLVVVIALYVQFWKSPSVARACVVGVVAGATIALTEHAWILAPVLVLAVAALVAYDVLGLAFENDSGGTDGYTVLSIPLARAKSAVDFYVPLRYVAPLLIVAVGVTAFLFAEWPPSLSGVLSFPMTMWEGVEFSRRLSSTGRTDPLFYVRDLAQTPILFSLGAVGLGTTLLRERVSFGRILFVVWFLGAFVLFTFVLSRQRHYYTIYVLTPLAILAGLGVEDLLAAVRRSLGSVDRMSPTVEIGLSIVFIVALTTSGFAYSAAGVDGPTDDYVGGYYWPSDEPEEDLFAKVNRVADRTGCAQIGWQRSDRYIKSIPAYYLYPRDMYLTDRTNRAASDVSKWPSVLVSEGPVERWSTPRTTETVYEGWHIYAPADGCS